MDLTDRLNGVNDAPRRAVAEQKERNRILAEVERRMEFHKATYDKLSAKAKADKGGLRIRGRIRELEYLYYWVKGE
jgi:hypothetical protein